MIWRLVSLLAAQLVLGLAGWWLGGRWPAAEHGAAWGALGGVVLASLVWLGVDSLRGQRVVRWLRGGDPAAAPNLLGLWGEVADRMRRALRTRDQRAQDSQARLQNFLAAIQASPNGVVLLDAGGRIEWFNQTAAQQLGLDPRHDLLQLIGNLVRDPLFAAYWASGNYTRDVVIPGPSASVSRPVKLSLHLHDYGEGRKLLLSRDVTALEQAEVMRRDFVANVSHEIRTPLTVLMGFVETLQNLPLEEADRTRYLGMMAQQAHRMQTLVNDLLTLSRLEGSPLPGLAEWTPVQALMTQCEQDGRALAKVLPHARSQTLHFETLAEGEVAGAPSELISAMSNLVSNAVRYTPAGGRIEAVWKLLPDGSPEFSVKDTGPGIAPEHISRLTERFYRVDRSRSRESGGTGLGLAIVKHVLQRHGGQLRIASEPGAGSTFAFTLPASRFRPAARTADAPVAQPATA